MPRTVTISNTAASIAGVALANYERQLIANEQEIGPSECRNSLISAARVALSQLDRAQGIDPVRHARIRAGFPA